MDITNLRNKYKAFLKDVVTDVNKLLEYRDSLGSDAQQIAEIDMSDGSIILPLNKLAEAMTKVDKVFEVLIYAKIAMDEYNMELLKPQKPTLKKKPK